MEKFDYKPTEIAAIGDQLITDIYGANKLDITSILVNPLTSKDYNITLVNRIIEKFIFNRLNKRELFLKGKYYE